MRRMASPYQRIMRAATKGRGVRLSADEVWTLSMDGAIETRAAVDNAADECSLLIGGHDNRANGICARCEKHVSEQ
jgi:hypothetical protein